MAKDKNKKREQKRLHLDKTQHLHLHQTKNEEEIKQTTIPTPIAISPTATSKVPTNAPTKVPTKALTTKIPNKTNMKKSTPAKIKVHSREYKDTVLFLERATFVLALIMCCIVPFITKPKEVASGQFIIYDFFGYFKAIAQYVLASVALILLFIHRVILKKPLHIRLSIALFTAWIVLSAFLSKYSEYTFGGYNMRYQGMYSYVCYFIFIVIFSNMLEKRFFKPLTYVTLIFASLMTVLSLTEYYGIQIMELMMSNTLKFTTLIHATFGNSNCIGSYYALMAPLAFIMFLRTRETKESIFLFIATLMTFTGLVISMTRVAWIGVIVACIFCMFFFIRDFRLFGLKLLVLFIVIASMVFVLNSTGKSRIVNKYTEAVGQVQNATKTDIRNFGSFRFYAYEKFIKLTLSSTSNELIGVGPDCLVFEGSTQADAEKFPELAGVTFDKAHSEPIEYAASTGIPSLIFYIWFIATIMLLWIKRLKAASPELLGIFAGALGYLIQSMANIAIIGIVGVFFVFCSILDAQLIKYPRPRGEKPESITLMNRIKKMLDWPVEGSTKEST